MKLYIVIADRCKLMVKMRLEIATVVDKSRVDLVTRFYRERDFAKWRTVDILQIFGGFSLGDGQDDGLCDRLCPVRHLAVSGRHLRALDLRLRRADVRRRRPVRVRRVSRRLAAAVDVPRVHRRRRVPHLLSAAARLHRRLLRADWHPSLAPSRRQSRRWVACRRQHPSLENAAAAHARNGRSPLRPVVATALRHQHVPLPSGTVSSGELR